jgi:hypothetical protein
MVHVAPGAGGQPAMYRAVSESFVSYLVINYFFVAIIR